MLVEERLRRWKMKPSWETKELNFRETCINHAERRTAHCPCCFELLEIEQEKCQKCGQKIDWKEFI